MRRKFTYSIIIALVLVVLGLLVIYRPQTALAPETPIVKIPENSKPIKEPIKVPSIKFDGVLILRLLETGYFINGFAIVPLKIVEDSRCPSDVVCIQAGKIRVEAEVAGTEAVTNVFSTGSTFSFEGYKITLLSADPYPVSTKQIGEKEYRFTFKVEKEKEVLVGKCYVGGCSSQVCSDQQDMMTTCEYREIYACYQGATCERQPDGKCGWTETPVLKACILEKSSM